MSVCLSLSAVKSNTVRKWTEINFLGIELNSKKPNKSQEVHTSHKRAQLWTLASRRLVYSGKNVSSFTSQKDVGPAEFLFLPPIIFTSGR